MLIHDKFYCKGYYDYDKFRNIAEQLTKRQNIEFALYCAKDVFHLVEDRYKERAKCCLDLVEKWLKDENSVTSKELRNAANASWVDANAAASASWTAAAAAARAAAHAAVRAVNWTAAYAAYYATAAAAAAVNANNNKFNEYLIIANSYLTKTTINCLNYEIEGKILYLIDELEENIIVHKDKYYVNMNGIENCPPEYGFNTQQELLNELLYSKDRFWVFVRNWLDQLYKEESNVNS